MSSLADQAFNAILIWFAIFFIVGIAYFILSLVERFSGNGYEDHDSEEIPEDDD